MFIRMANWEVLLKQFYTSIWNMTTNVVQLKKLLFLHQRKKIDFRSMYRFMSYSYNDKVCVITFTFLIFKKNLISKYIFNFCDRQDKFFYCNTLGIEFWIENEICIHRPRTPYYKLWYSCFDDFSVDWLHLAKIFSWLRHLSDLSFSSSVLQFSSYWNSLINSYLLYICIFYVMFVISMLLLIATETNVFNTFKSCLTTFIISTQVSIQKKKILKIN